METLGLILTAIGCTASAVWLLRSSLGSVEKALAVHVIEEAAERQQLTARVVKLERKRR